MGAKWSKENFTAVTIGALVNGLIYGTIAWLVVGLWLEMFSYLNCWVVATVISWPIAIWREARRMVRLEDLGTQGPTAKLATMEAEFKAGNEIKPVLEELDEMEAEEGGEGLRHIKSNITDGLLVDVNKVKEALEMEGVDERVFCVNVIYKVLERELPSGQHHIYRGVLDDVGQELLKLWDYVVKEMELLGNLGAEEVDDEKQWMRDQISEAG